MRRLSLCAPISGTTAGFNISNGVIVSDSFTLSEASTISGVQFGSWNFASDNDATTSVDWSITSGADTGTSYGGATATIASSTQDTTPGIGLGGAYNIFDNDFSTGSVDLGAGTYYLNLQNAIASSGGQPNTDPVLWDDNNGPSDAVQPDGFGDLRNNPYAFTGSNSESFQLFGTNDTSVVPEPSGFVPVSIGVLFVGFLIMRRRPQSV
jgi:hypothetical protein